VFGGPKIEQSKRERLNHNDKGRDGLFGNTMEKDAYAKKTTFAAEISTKEATRGPDFANAGAEERKNQELYGGSSYNAPGREKNNQRKPA
jgi:hypothetical protein